VDIVHRMYTHSLTTLINMLKTIIDTTSLSTVR